MKVSILIPIYNAAPYISRCLLSVAEQSYQDIECILVDDCGNDNSIELAQKFIDNYKGIINFIILHHEKNKGVAAARNTCIEASTGDFIFFLDSDDVITVNCIEDLVALTKKYPDIDFVQGNTLDENGNISRLGWHIKLPEYCHDKEELEKNILSVVISSPWNKLIRKSFLTEHKLTFPEGIVHEDMFWCFFIAKYAKAVAYENKGTYIYYNNENSIITSISDKSRIHRYSSRLYASNVFCTDLHIEQKASKYQRLYVARNLISAMMDITALHSIAHWHVFWKHVIHLYTNHHRLTIWHHLLFVCMMPPLCLNRGWHWRIEQYLVNRC